MYDAWSSTPDATTTDAAHDGSSPRAHTLYALDALLKKTSVRSQLGALRRAVEDDGDRLLLGPEAAARALARLRKEDLDPRVARALGLA